VLTHVPISGVGSRQIRHFELPLVRYDLPPFSNVSPSPEPPLSQETNKPRSPRIRYSVHPPKSPIGPLDLVSVPIHLHPLDRTVAVRNASIVIERRIVLHDLPPNSAAALTLQPSLSSSSLTRSSSLNPNPSSLPRSPNAYSPSFQDSEHDSNSTSSTLSIPTTITPGTVYPSAMSFSSDTPLLPNGHNHFSNSSSSTSSSSKVIVNAIVGTESSGTFSRDENGTYSKTLTLQWPAAKSHSRWAIGESISSELVSVKYFVRTKVNILYYVFHLHIS